MEFLTLPFEEIVKRLLDSSYDLECYRVLADYYPPQEKKLSIAKYEKSTKKERERELKELGKKCATQHKFKGHNWQEVVFDTVCRIQIPPKWFRYIFGHVYNEDELYPPVRRLLKRVYNEYKLVDTHDKRSKVGIRWADFTLVKEKFLGRYELVSVDAKVDRHSFEYFLNQADDFLRFSDYTLLACTPGLILEVGKQEPVNAEKIFVDKLKKAGIGLYVVDARFEKSVRLVDAKKSSNLHKDKKNNALRELNVL